jgi:hypothetical protein
MTELNLLLHDDIESGAEFSDDRIFRYALWRVWGSGRRRLVVVGLNPSTADEHRDDPTIRRCIAFAKRERCDGLVMLNLFAYRATDPNDLYARHVAGQDVIGNPEHDAAIHRHGWGDEVVVVAAWGSGVERRPEYRERAAAVAHSLPYMVCFGLTQDRHPRHPLYVRGDTPLVYYPKPIDKGYFPFDTDSSMAGGGEEA